MTDHERWLADRQRSLGASECAAALGLNPYCSPRELWAEKAGLVAPKDLGRNAHVKWGRLLEPVIGFAYAQSKELDPAKLEFMANGLRIWRNPKWPFLHATPDFFACVNGITWPIECKTGTSRVWGDWKQEDPPIYYHVQCQIQLLILEKDWLALYALVDGWREDEFHVWRDQEFLDAALPKLERFWACVTTQTPPED